MNDAQNVNTMFAYFTQNPESLLIIICTVVSWYYDLYSLIQILNSYFDHRI